MPCWLHQVKRDLLGHFLGAKHQNFGTWPLSGGQFGFVPLGHPFSNLSWTEQSYRTFSGTTHAFSTGGKMYHEKLKKLIQCALIIQKHFCSLVSWVCLEFLFSFFFFFPQYFIPKLADEYCSCFENMEQMDSTNIGQQLHSGICFKCKRDKCELRN